MSPYNNVGGGMMYGPGTNGKKYNMLHTIYQFQIFRFKLKFKKFKGKFGRNK